MSAFRGGAYTALGYKAAEHTRARPNDIPTAGSGDYQNRFDRETLVRESQRLDRDNGLYRGLVGRALDNILGTGFGFQSRAKQADKIEALFKDWSRDPEVRGLLDFNSLQRTVLRSLFVDGDIGAIKVGAGAYAGRVQLIESERITSLRQTIGNKDGKAYVDQGIELDPAVGRAVAYHVADYSRWGHVKKTVTRRIDAQDFLFVANLDRASQSRGMPAMTSNMPMLHRLNDILDAESVAWQLLSRFALTVYRDESARQAYLESESDDEKTEARQQPPRYQEFDWGIIFNGSLGEKVESIKHDLPGANFEQSVRVYLRLLGLPLGMPLELILLDWSQTNYSSARAALEQAYRMFTTWQQLLLRRFYSPLIEWLIGRWIEVGQLEQAKDVLAHEWITPEFPWLDQLKEANAWGVRLDRGLATHAQALKAVNRDRGEWIEAREGEIRDAIGRAQKIGVETGEKVDWRIFVGYDPKGEKAGAEAQAKQQEAAGEQAEDPEEKDPDEAAEEDERRAAAARPPEPVVLHLNVEAPKPLPAEPPKPRKFVVRKNAVETVLEEVPAQPEGGAA